MGETGGFYSGLPEGARVRLESNLKHTRSGQAGNEKGERCLFIIESNYTMEGLVLLDKVTPSIFISFTTSRSTWINCHWPQPECDCYAYLLRILLYLGLFDLLLVIDLLVASGFLCLAASGLLCLVWISASLSLFASISFAFLC